jgi:hypothetical protein
MNPNNIPDMEELLKKLRARLSSAGSGGSGSPVPRGYYDV